MQFFHKTNINFIGLRKFFFTFSLVFNVVGLALVLVLGVDLGIDFTGGSEVAVKFEKSVHTDAVRDAIKKGGITAEEVKSYGAENQFLIRLKESGKITDKINEALKSSFTDNKFEILKNDTIGPKIGEELAIQALIAVILSMIAIMIYVAFRFKFEYGFGAIIALVHDVIFTIVVIVLAHKLGLMNLEVNQSIVAALLTVVGFSVNDTVIIFDRIRENLDKVKGVSFYKLVNLSINETLSRTINTVLTVVAVLLSIVIFGGPVLEGFAFTMLIGIVIGTYSSIYISGSFVIWYLEKRGRITHDESLDRKKSVATA